MKSLLKVVVSVPLCVVVLVGLLSCQTLAIQGEGHGSGGVTQVGDGGSTSINLEQLQAALEQMPINFLSDSEREGILYVREEEKLARDVYLALYEKWELPIFQNIAASETTHMGAMKLLIDHYELEDPALAEQGKFANEDLQGLYDQLVAQGSQSLVEALKVGAAIEELDIVDIKGYLAQVDNDDIKLVYENLLKGSRSHLRAFASTLERYGVTYTPQFLSQEEYEEIVGSPMETGTALP